MEHGNGVFGAEVQPLPLRQDERGGKPEPRLRNRKDPCEVDPFGSEWKQVKLKV